jgi:steroid 5-alpha reductase family enzyme
MINTSNISKKASVMISLAAYAVAIAIVMLTFPFLKNYHILVKIALADLVGTIIIFLFSMVFNNSSLYDPYWSVKPLVIAVFYFLLVPPGSETLCHLLTLTAVFLYALRLTTNFYKGWAGLGHEDWRYQNFRKQFPRMYWPVSFLGIHFFPSVMVYLGCLPLLIIFNESVIFPALSLTGLFITFGSVFLVFIADKQLHRFKAHPENKGSIIQTGLWAKSRHPNYFGEILTWWGLFIVALGYGLENWWTGIGALTITIMFMFISIPMIEKKMAKNKPGYAQVQKDIPVIFPRLF